MLYSIQLIVNLTKNQLDTKSSTQMYSNLPSNSCTSTMRKNRCSHAANNCHIAELLLVLFCIDASDLNMISRTSNAYGMLIDPLAWPCRALSISDNKAVERFKLR